MATSVTKRVTATKNFGSCNPEQDLLFSVNPGVPVLDALETASCFLGDALDAMGRTEEPCFAAFRCVDFARAIINAVIVGEQVHGAKGGAE